jgi:hypothetical protein
MSNNRWDLTINGINCRLVRGEGAYGRFFSKQTVEENLLSPAPGLTSRTDKRKFYQTSWAGGATWYRPIMTPEIADTYQFSRGLDMNREPGKIWPHNQVNYLRPVHKGWITAYPTPASAAPPLTGSGQTTIYGINSTYNLRYWDGTAWVSSTGTIGGSGSGSQRYWQLAYNAADSYFYAFTGGAGTAYISYTDGTITSGANAIAITPTYGATLLPGLQGSGGNMHFYDGSVLYKINDARTALEVLTDDGFGPDVLSGMPDTGTSNPIYTPFQRMAVSSSEGIYYAKNVWGPNGIPVGWLFRVERDAAGNTISTPIATLPAGNVILSVGYSYGNPVMIATEEWGYALDNDNPYTTQLWSVFGGTLGLLGSFNSHDPDFLNVYDPQETVSNIIGAWNGYLAMGSDSGIWIYDPVRGGVHYWDDTDPNAFLGRQEHFMIYVPWYQNGVWMTSGAYFKDPKRSNDYTEYGASNSYSHRMWSNWFDFGLPGEEKTITKIRTRLGEYDTNTGDEWWVTIYDADGNEYDADINGVPHEHRYGTLGDTVYESDWSITSEKFMYSIAFTRLSGGSTSDPAHLTGIWITAETGDILKGWSLRIDGTVFENVEGEPQDPLDVYDNWVALGELGTPVTLVDNFEAHDRRESTSHRVKVQSVNISKGDPNESYIEVTLIEA